MNANLKLVSQINFKWRLILARLPKWFGERPGKKTGEPETPEGLYQLINSILNVTDWYSNLYHSR